MDIINISKRFEIIKTDLLHSGLTGKEADDEVIKLLIDEFFKDGDTKALSHMFLLGRNIR